MDMCVVNTTNHDSKLFCVQILVQTGSERTILTASFCILFIRGDSGLFKFKFCHFLKPPLASGTTGVRALFMTTVAKGPLAGQCCGCSWRACKVGRRLRSAQLGGNNDCNHVVAGIRVVSCGLHVKLFRPVKMSGHGSHCHRNLHQLCLTQQQHQQQHDSHHERQAVVGSPCGAPSTL